jgi:NAD-dependent dihydropyrimidine dehydrogenase PreA subunit
MGLRYLKNVTTLRLDPAQCVGCGLCVTVCPQAVLALEGGKAVIVDRDACMECGACAHNCPSAALSVQAGVGCAQAVINSALGRTSGACCCTLEPRATSLTVDASPQPPPLGPPPKSGCC